MKLGHRSGRRMMERVWESARAVRTRSISWAPAAEAGRLITGLAEPLEAVALVHHGVGDAAEEILGLDLRFGPNAVRL